jgi:hypothetical protein
MVNWRIKGQGFQNCNCNYGCPCQFNALPTHDNCEAVMGYEINEGHFGDVNLDGLKVAGIYSWPGPVHEGNGRMQLIIDEKANEQQRNALIKIMQGEETEPMATMWAVYSAMSPNKLEPLSKPIDLVIDVENRNGQIFVPGVFETKGEPIRNAVTGEIQRARIDLPHGFEYEIAEMGSASTKATGEIKLNFENSYGQFAELHISHMGVVRSTS